MLGNHLVRARVGRGHRRQKTALGAILAVAVVVIASCTHAGNDNQKDTMSRQFTHPSGADQVVIQVSSGGGLVQPVVRVGDSLPRVWISGDGHYLRHVTQQTDTPALVALEERRIPEATLQNLLTEANNAGTPRRLTGLRRSENLRCRQHPHSRRHRRQAARRTRTRAGVSRRRPRRRHRRRTRARLALHRLARAPRAHRRCRRSAHVHTDGGGGVGARTGYGLNGRASGNVAARRSGHGRHADKLARPVGPVPRRDRRRLPRRGLRGGWNNPNRAVAFRGCSLADCDAATTAGRTHLRRLRRLACGIRAGWSTW